MTGVVIMRGDVVIAVLDPVVGSEQGKLRPVVVVSNDGANESASTRGRGVITVVPMTSNVLGVKSFQARLDAGEAGIRVASKVQVEQIRSIDISRVVQSVGVLGAERMAEIDEDLRMHLGL